MIIRLNHCYQLNHYLRYYFWIKLKHIKMCVVYVCAASVDETEQRQVC
jgi:hypothetical protein